VAQALTALFKDPVRTTLQTLFISVIKTNNLKLEVAQAQTPLFISEKKNVYSVVRTGSLNKADCANHVRKCRASQGKTRELYFENKCK
jgi:hypothetical protein